MMLPEWRFNPVLSQAQDPSAILPNTNEEGPFACFPLDR